MNSDVLSVSACFLFFSAVFSSRFELMNVIEQEKLEMGNQITFNTFMVARLKAVL